MNKILVVRTDRLGDVLLTTPVSTALREMYPQAKISWLVRSYAAPLLEHNSDVDHVIIDHGGSTGARGSTQKRTFRYRDRRLSPVADRLGVVASPHSCEDWACEQDLFHSFFAKGLAAPFRRKKT